MLANRILNKNRERERVSKISKNKNLKMFLGGDTC